MTEYGTRRYLAFLLATTSIISTAICVGQAAANDETQPVVASKPAANAGRNANAQAVQLDTITVESRRKRRRTTTAARAPAVPPPAPPVVVTNAGGDVGYHANSTSSATKTNTPLRNIPQSVTVITKQQIEDIGALRLEDVSHYVPGVSTRQAEGNRDEIVIRGQSSNADFFVNGVRDDGQVYRDLYNTERLEYLKGPNALIFGRGGGGGVVNRVLKEADGIPISQWKTSFGTFGEKRVSADVGDKIAPNLYARINGVFENSDSYRDYFNLQRGGINPTLTWLATPLTKVKLSYEYFRDERTADRGIPSQFGYPYFPASPNQFFGNPALSATQLTQNNATAVVEHDFNNGLTVKNQTRFATYSHVYQNVYPNGASAVTAAGTYTQAAYNNTNDRQNILNQTDWTYKFNTDVLKHTVVFGTEFGNQKSANQRFSGIFPNGATTQGGISAANPTTFQNVVFPGAASDARNKTNLNLAAIYAQDQIEVTRWLQLIGGVRFDRFDLTYVNFNGAPAVPVGASFGRIDNLVSPRGGVVIKPIDPLSLYGSYSISYLPSSGDQFGALNSRSVLLMPEKFTNKEIGAKWDILPRLTFTSAFFRLDRENTPILDPATPGLVVASGHSRVLGIEAGLAGYVTERWQISAGYTSLNARFVTATSNTGSTTAAPALAAAAGAHVPFVPTNMYSLWNRYDINYNWGVGVGIISQDRYYAAVDNTVQIPGYTRVDGAIFWRLNKYVKAQINVENIFGAKYYPTVDGNNNIMPGSPRAARFQLTTNFTGEDRSGSIWGPGAATLFRPSAVGPAGSSGFGPAGTY